MNHPVTQDTEYSSEDDSFFLSQRLRENRAQLGKKRSGIELDSPIQEEAEKVPDHSQKSPQSLITWAARLELESITLKELVEDELVKTIKENQTETSVLISRLTTKLERVEREWKNCCRDLKAKNCLGSAKADSQLLNKFDVVNSKQNTLLNNMKTLEQVVSTFQQKVNSVDAKVETMSRQMNSVSRILETISAAVVSRPEPKDMNDIKSPLHQIAPKANVPETITSTLHARAPIFKSSFSESPEPTSPTQKPLMKPAEPTDLDSPADRAKILSSPAEEHAAKQHPREEPTTTGLRKSRRFM